MLFAQKLKNKVSAVCASINSNLVSHREFGNEKYPTCVAHRQLCIALSPLVGVTVPEEA
jgi:hypothetical protein